MRPLLLLLLITLSISSYCQWTSNTSVNTEVAPLNTGPMGTATTSDGKTWIAFYHNVGGAYQMRAQLLDVNGNALLGTNGVLVSSEPSGSATFVYNVCLNPSDNALIIAFQYQVAGVNTAVITKVETNGNLPWGAPGTLLTAGLAPYPCVLSTGEIIVAWNNSSPGTTYMQKLTAAGTLVWGSPVSVQVGVTNTTASQPIGISEGAYILIIQRKGVGVSSTLFAQRYTNSGTPVWAAPVQLSNITTSTVRYYSLLTDADTAYLGYYAASGSRFLSYLQRINPDGVIPYGINGAVFSTYSTGSDPYMMTTDIEKVPGAPYIWSVVSASNTAQSQYGVYAQKFDMATGAKMLNPLGKEIYPISAAREQHFGSISIYNGGPVFMHYEDVNYHIFATRLDDQGNFVWPGNKVELSSTNATLAVPKGRFAFTKMVNNQAVAVWNENRGVQSEAYAQNITAAGVTGPIAVVPITLTDFSGNRNGKIVVLKWTTLTEINNSGFYIERSMDGRSFSSLGFIHSKGPNGNSNVKLDYVFSDPLPFSGSNYYRLKQVDKDGKIVYSKVVIIKPINSSGIIIGDLYPNPVRNVFNVPVESISAEKLSYTVSDVHGKPVLKGEAEVRGGHDILNVDVSGFASGNYFLKVIQDNKHYTIQKFLKQ